MIILRKQDGITIADLKRVLATWTETDRNGGPLRVIISTNSTNGISGCATAISCSDNGEESIRLETGNRPPGFIREDGLMSRIPRPIPAVQPGLDDEETRLQVAHYRAELYRVGQMAINCTKSQSKDPAEWRRDLEEIVDRTQRFLNV